MGSATDVLIPEPSPGKPQVPIYPYKVASGFGAVRNSPADGACGGGPHPCTHYGEDVVGAPGTVVKAPEGGTIVTVSNGAGSPWGGYGPWLVVIQGDSGKFHLLAHLDPATAEMGTMGARVSPGDPVGTVSSAWHTHWEVRDKMIPDFAAGEHNHTNNMHPKLWLAGARVGTFGTVLVVGSAAILLALLVQRARSK